MIGKILAGINYLIDIFRPVHKPHWRQLKKEKEICMQEQGY